jgi:hypothetical protein
MEAVHCSLLTFRMCCMQEEAALDPAVLGKEMAAQETEEGSTFRVFHAHLATADPALKVRGDAQL